MKSLFSTSLFLAALFSFAEEPTSATQQAQGLPPSSLPYEKITPNAGPRVQEGGNIFLTADFIFWTVREDGLEYAFTDVGAINTGLEGRVRRPDFNWEPGFKAGLGYNLDHDGWNLFAQYTWIHSGNTHDKVIPGAGFILNTFWDFQRATYLEAQANWSLHFNAADLELGRNFFISRYLKLRPHFGAKITWQKQNFKMATLFDQFGDLRSQNIRLRQKQWGFGLRSGLNMAWQFNRTWSVYSDIALSALLSQFKNHRKQIIADPATGIPTAESHVGATHHTLKYVAEWDIGIRADFWWAKDRYHMLFQAGWEEQIWFSQNQFINLVLDLPYVARGSDLFFQGLTARARFDF